MRHLGTIISGNNAPLLERQDEASKDEAKSKQGHLLMTGWVLSARILCQKYCQTVTVAVAHFLFIQMKTTKWWMDNITIGPSLSVAKMCKATRRLSREWMQWWQSWLSICNWCPLCSCSASNFCQLAFLASFICRPLGRPASPLGPLGSRSAYNFCHLASVHLPLGPLGLATVPATGLPFNYSLLKYYKWDQKKRKKESDVFLLPRYLTR